MLSIGLPAHAVQISEATLPRLILPSSTTDPLIPIYRASGIVDSGDIANAGVATSVTCTNLSSVSGSIRYIVRNFGGTVVSSGSARFKLGGSPADTLCNVGWWA